MSTEIVEKLKVAKRTGKYLYAIGRRKSSVARVRVYKRGSGKIEINSKPKICLIHGKEDEVVPKKMMESTEIVLKESDIDINTHLIKNLGHSINQEGLEIGQNFLVKYLLKC